MTNDPEREQPRYRLLGPVSVRGDDGPVRLGAQKQRAVLAALLLNANRVVSESRLFDLVWGEQAPRSVRGRLQVHISELRGLLGREVIVRPSSGYLIEVRPGELDVDVFDEAVVRARAEFLDGHPAPAADRLRAALALWDGPALGGVTESLVDREGPAVEERRLAALEELYEAELAAGRHAQVIGELRGIAGDHPFRERLQAHLMLAMHRCGRTPEALGVYSDTRRKLRVELGIDPGQHLQQLHQRILAGDQDPPASASVAAPPDERIRPAELPHDVRGFAGRGAELSTLDPGAIWMISGTAGVGKTALAVHWAHANRERFPDGQLYLDLRGFDPDHEPLTPTAALVELTMALGLEPQQLPPGVDDQARRYRSLLAGREILLVLDNARDAAQVLPLLPSAGTVLVTSRNRLGELVARAGARQLSLGALPVEECRVLLAGMLGADRVAAEPDAVADLARICGHLPLALRIAAANIGATPGSDIAAAAEELARGNPLTDLTIDGAEESALAAAFTVSYRALPPDQQRLFRLLGIVPGPDFTPRAAASIAGSSVPEAARWLTGLAAANLVEHHTRARYRFHDLVRLHASGRALAEESDGDRSRAWTRLVGYYLAAADAATGHRATRLVELPREQPAEVTPLPKVTDPAAAAAWWEAEIANLAAALRHGSAHGPFPATWYLADSVRDFYTNHGRRAEWLEIGPVVLDAARESGERSVEALLHHSLGQFYAREGHHEQGIHHLAEAVRVSRALGWRECEATALGNLGSTLELTGRLTEAVECTRRAITLFREIDYRSGECFALNSLGTEYYDLGRLDLAEECLRTGLDLSRDAGLKFWEGANLVELASVWWAVGRVEDAEECLASGQRLFDELGVRYGQVTALNVRGRVSCDSGDYEAARSTAARAAELAAQDGDKLVEVKALTTLGEAMIGLGLLEQAETHLLRARETAVRAGLHVRLAQVLALLAKLLAGTGGYREAFGAATEALAVPRGGGYRLAEAGGLTTMAEASFLAGEREQAEQLAQRALVIWRAAGHTTGETRVLHTLDQL